MGRSIDEVIKALPKERQKRIAGNARQLATEMIRHADSLEQLRKAVGKTQLEVAETLGIKQHAVSQLESRTDLYVSTLNKYVRALGHRLELSLVTASGERVELPNLHPWERANLPEPSAVRKGSAGAARDARSPAEIKRGSKKSVQASARAARQELLAAGSDGPDKKSNRSGTHGGTTSALRRSRAK